VFTSSEPWFRFRDFLGENKYNLVVAAGIVLLFAGILDLSTITSSAAVVTVFLGLVLTPIGVLAKLEIITLNFSTREKIGSLLIVMSILFFSGSIVGPLVQDIAGVRVLTPFGAARAGLSPDTKEVRVELGHPFLWIVVPLAIAGVVCLVLGIVLKKR
jgi:hypothetical protein